MSLLLLLLIVNINLNLFILSIALYYFLYVHVFFPANCFSSVRTKTPIPSAVRSVAC